MKAISWNASGIDVRPQETSIRGRETRSLALRNNRVRNIVRLRMRQLMGETVWSRGDFRPNSGSNKRNLNDNSDLDLSDW